MPYGSSVTSNGLAPACEDANEAWPAGWQSWVITTLSKARARRSTSGMIASPSATASAPPGRKSFCTSMTRRASSPVMTIGDSISASPTGPRELADPPALEQYHDDERKHERQDQIQQPKYQQRSDHARARRVGHRRDERILQHAQPSRSMGNQRERERDEKYPDHHDEAGMVRRRQRKIDDPGRADQFQRGRQQLPRGDRGARVYQFEAANPQRTKTQQRAQRIEPGNGEQRRRQRARRPMRPGHVAPQEIRFDEQGQTAQQQIAQRESEGAKRDEDADFRRAEAFGGISAIADHRAGKDGRADVVGERVGGEGGQSDKPPVQPPSEMGERDLIVAGERGIGHHRRGDGEQP